MNVKGVVAIAAILGAAWLAAQYSPLRQDEQTVSAAAAPCPGGAGMAFVMSQKFVKQALRAPATAQFPNTSETTQIGDCKFNVRAHVDAQNGFGALIRSNYSATLEYVPSSKEWRATNVVVE